MADVMSNYVKFLRGTPTAYHKLPQKDADTLYFVSEADATVGQLWLGEKLITSTTSPEGIIDHLSELLDVDIAGAQHGMVLGFDEIQEKWIPMEVNAAVEVSIMKGASETEDGAAGLVPAPKIGEQDYFLRGDGTWAPVNGNEDSLSFKTIDSLDAIKALIGTEDADKYIYLVSVGDTENNKYDEYIIVGNDVEKLGAQEVNLDDYVTTTALENALADKVTTTQLEEALEDKVTVKEGYDLVSNEAIAKLETIGENAQENYIKSVTSDFTVSEEGQLSLNALEIADVTGLQDKLNTKVDRQFTTVENEDGSTTTTEWTLMSPTDKKKLDALVLEGENIEISGTVNAANVEGLNEWIATNKNLVDGLYPAADKEKLAGVEEGAQKNYITSTTEDFKVEDGKLHLQSISVSQVKNLQDLLDAKTDASQVTNLEATVTTLNSTVTNLDTKVATLETKVTNLDEVVNKAETGLVAKVANLEDVVSKLSETYVTLEKYNADMSTIKNSIVWQEMANEEEN